MKHFKSIFSKIAIGIIFIISNTFIAHAQDGPSATDSIEISLLTCAPHNEVYSIYGHTAIRYTNKTKGTDWTFNYGIFDFKKSFFVLRFLFGFTDYQLGVIPFYYFEKEYKSGNTGTGVLLSTDKVRDFYLGFDFPDFGRSSTSTTINVDEIATALSENAANSPITIQYSFAIEQK